MAFGFVFLMAAGVYNGPPAYLAAKIVEFRPVLRVAVTTERKK